MANGTPSPNGATVQQVAVRTRTTIQHVFALEVEEKPDGERQLNAHLPGGEMMAFLLTAEMAKQLGETLIAPRVEVPVNGAQALH